MLVLALVASLVALKLTRGGVVRVQGIVPLLFLSLVWRIGTPLLLRAIHVCVFMVLLPFEFVELALLNQGL